MSLLFNRGENLLARIGQCSLRIVGVLSLGFTSCCLPHRGDPRAWEWERMGCSQQLFALRLLFRILAGCRHHFKAVFNSLSSCSPPPPCAVLWRQPWGQRLLGCFGSWAAAGGGSWEALHNQEPGRPVNGFSPPRVLIVVAKIKCFFKINILILRIYFPTGIFNVRLTQQTSQNRNIFNCCRSESQPGISENHSVRSG